MTQRQTLSRLIHGDNLKNWPLEDVGLIQDKIHLHILKCSHPKCDTMRCMIEFHKLGVVETVRNAIY